MRLSVIIPVYNVEKYLKECIYSVIDQNIKGIEIIAVNDGSTDSSLKILEEIKNKEKNSNIVIIDQNNKGISESRNTGLKIAKGKYIYFMDSDDFLVEKGLKKLLSIIEEKKVDIARGEYVNYYNDKIIEKIYKNEKLNMIGKEYLRKKIKSKEYISVIWTCIYKKEFLKNNNLLFYSKIYHEDDEFNYRAIYLAKKIIETNIMLYYYRQREGSIMNNKNKTLDEKINYINSCFVIGENLKNFLKLNEEEDFILKEGVLSYYLMIPNKINTYKVKVSEIKFIVEGLKKSQSDLLDLTKKLKDKIKIYEMTFYLRFYLLKRYLLRKDKWKS